MTTRPRTMTNAAAAPVAISMVASDAWLITLVQHAIDAVFPAARTSVRPAGAIAPDMLAHCDVLVLEMRCATPDACLEALPGDADAADRPFTIVCIPAGAEGAELAGADIVLPIPATPDDIRSALDSAAQALAAATASAWESPMPEAEGESPRTLLVKDKGSLRVTPIDAVRWIESQGNRVIIHATDGSYRSTITLTRASVLLDQAGFARVHRSALVNVRRITAIRRLGRGDFVVVLDGGEAVRGSRMFWHCLRPRLGSAL